MKEAYRRIEAAEKILLVTHGKPDGDAVSSICAMMLVCERMGKRYKAFCTHPAPRPLHFLPYSERIETFLVEGEFASYDLIIALDCGSLSRTNLSREIRARKKHQLTIEFDHHLKMDDYSDIEIRIPNAASTSEVLYYFFKENRVRIDKKLADCILTGLLTDTGNFLYPSTTDKAISIASEMLLHGAKYPRITEETWRNKSIGAMKLWGKAIGSLEINKKYQIAISVLTKKDLSECECDSEEIDGISGFLSNLYGVNALLFLIETDDGKIKGSLRTSVPGLDISKLAQRLGGGGHAMASGFVLEGALFRESNVWKLK